MLFVAILLASSVNGGVVHKCIDQIEGKNGWPVIPISRAKVRHFQNDGIFKYKKNILGWNSVNCVWRDSGAHLEQTSADSSFAFEFAVGSYQR